MLYSDRWQVTQFESVPLNWQRAIKFAHDPFMTVIHLYINQFSIINFDIIHLPFLPSPGLPTSQFPLETLFIVGKDRVQEVYRRRELRQAFIFIVVLALDTVQHSTYIFDPSVVMAV